MSNDEREPEGFLEKNRSRKNRKRDRAGDINPRIHRADTANDRWRFDPSKLDDEDGDFYYDEDPQG